ncbi:tRNA (N6-isopentenyl adenosine(37)-C2)-methylthiotransferase MiaB [Alphaproteobacteria bacterium]|nr:tRNA (N6-isopentenyl adenosine(37)-C2)-methylthiotransferase MiaB [Alphaproteobacteria bacterium]
MTAPIKRGGVTTRKSLFIKTYGCQMNVYDSDRMAEVLAPLGYEIVGAAEGADMIILNTCHIREKATEKVFSELGRLRRLKTEAIDRGGNVLLAVAGCVAQAQGQEILDRAPYVDLVFGPQTYHRLPEMVYKANAGDWAKGRGARLIDTEFPVESKFDYLPQQSMAASSAFLTIQEGCDKFCSFCVVPYTRGVEMSRSALAVLDEARHLVAGGALEITLLGQNVNAYHGEAVGGGEWSLARLIRELAKISGLERIRYTTSHPRDMGDDLILAHRDVPQLMPFLHLPVQSGSDRILETMNRKHDVASYLRLVDRLREARPDLALSSDFIVGHPGESDADFAETINLVSRVGFVQAYSFKYSPRPGTPAATLDQIPESVRSERLQSLQQLLGVQARAFNVASVGDIQPVLVERAGQNPGQLRGRGPYMQAVHFDGPERLLGTIADVRITEGLGNSLAGRIEFANTTPANTDTSQGRKGHGERQAR